MLPGRPTSDDDGDSVLDAETLRRLGGRGDGDPAPDADVDREFDVDDDDTPTGEASTSIHVEGPDDGPALITDAMSGDELDAAVLAAADRPVPDHVDLLAVAELKATGGPSYDLAELDEAARERLEAELGGAGVRWAFDFDGSLVVHRNDEERTDLVMTDVFGADEAGTGRGGDGGPGFETRRDELRALGAERTPGGVSPIDDGSSSAAARVAVLVLVAVLALLLLFAFVV